MNKEISHIEYEVGSGNVFKDLGLDNPELLLEMAQQCKCKSDFIKMRGIANTGMSTDEITGIMRGSQDNSPRGVSWTSPSAAVRVMVNNAQKRLDELRKGITNLTSIAEKLQKDIQNINVIAGTIGDEKTK